MRWKLSMTMLCVLLGLSLPAWAQSGDAPGATQLNTVDTLDVVEREDGTYIRLTGSQVPTFSVFKLNDPLRLFVDISNSDIAKQTLTEDVHNGVISRVALIEFEDSFQSVARLIIGFDQAAHYDVRTEGNDVVVFVDGANRRARSSQDLASVERELEAQQARLSAAENQLRQTEKRYSNAVGELETTRGQLSKTEAELKAMQARVASTSGQERRDLEAAIASHNDTLKAAQAKVEEREALVTTMRDQIAALEKSHKQSQRQHEAALERAQKAEAARERASERASRLEERLAKTQSELESIAAEKESAQGRLASMSNEVQQTMTRV
ncbi:MAG: AMIN domain-containing protein, partial [Bradymonadaceae bacterium]